MRVFAMTSVRAAELYVLLSVGCRSDRPVVHPADHNRRLHRADHCTQHAQGSQ